MIIFIKNVKLLFGCTVTYYQYYYVNSLKLFICCRMSGWHLNEDSLKSNHKVFTLERNKLRLEVKHNEDLILSIEMRTYDTGTFTCFSNHRGIHTRQLGLIFLFLKEIHKEFHKMSNCRQIKTLSVMFIISKQTAKLIHVIT